MEHSTEWERESELITNNFSRDTKPKLVFMFYRNDSAKFKCIIVHVATKIACDLPFVLFVQR